MLVVVFVERRWLISRRAMGARVAGRTPRRARWPTASWPGGAGPRGGRGTRDGRRCAAAGSAALSVRRSRARLSRHSRWVQAIRSCAISDSSSQTALSANSRNGRFSSPVCFAPRIRFSASPRPRCSRSISTMSPAISVSVAWKRCPSWSVNFSCAPGCGRSRRMITRDPFGHGVRSSRSTCVISAICAPSRSCRPGATPDATHPRAVAGSIRARR